MKVPPLHPKEMRIGFSPKAQGMPWYAWAIIIAIAIYLLLLWLDHRAYSKALNKK